MGRQARAVHSSRSVSTFASVALVPALDAQPRRTPQLCLLAGALMAWLAMPWRLAARLLTGLGIALSGPQTRHGPVMVVVAGTTVAVTRALHQGQLLVRGVLLPVGLAAVICPLADAAVSRRAEFAADRFAADHGLALQLAAALSALDDGRCAASGWLWRLLASHPTSDRRIGALLAAAASPVRPPESAGATSTALPEVPDV